MQLASVYYAWHTISSRGKQLSIWAKAHHINGFGVSRKVRQELDDCLSIPVCVYTPQLQHAKIYSIIQSMVMKNVSKSRNATFPP